jgi:tight adherence protein B
MMFSPGSGSMLFAACLAIGLAIAIATYASRRWLRRGLDAMERDMSDKLHRMHIPVRHVRRYLIAWLIVACAVLLVLSVGLGSPMLGAAVAGFLLPMPWYLVRRFAHRRRQQMEDQLADAMIMLANSVRAGLSLSQSLEILATQCPPPISFEFQQIVAEYRLGKPLDATLNEAKRRLRSENVALFAAALLASHESGGRLDETVERIAHSVQTMQRLERKVLSETAQARKSAVYMALVPLIMLVVYFFVEPVNTRLLFVTVFGQALLCVAGLLNVVAYLWARAILSPDI